MTGQPNRIIFALLLMAGLAVAAWVSPALAEPRVALVIGNGDYGAAIGRLPNPANDAALMGSALKRTGFEVILVTDADQKKMKRAISDFGRRLAAAGPDVTALFYYSGHGLQVAGENYLVPVNAVIEREADVDLEALSADTVLKQMEFSQARVNIVILDACRNNPLARSMRSLSSGLARMDAPRGSFIAYSTAPGAVAADGEGRNSPYTAALAEAIVTPGLSIEEAFRNVRGSVLKETGETQVPWESSSLTASFYFTPPKGTEPGGGEAAGAAGGGSGDQRAVEMTFWNSVKDSSDPADFTAYLEQYPKGNFARLAKNRLALLQGPQQPAMAPEPVVPASAPPETPAAQDTTAAEDETAAKDAAVPANVPSDPGEAARICDSEDAEDNLRIAACAVALRDPGLDAPVRASYINQRGRSFYSLGRLDAAEKEYREAMRLSPDEAAYHHNLGEVLNETDRSAEAVAEHNRAIELDPTDVWNFYGRGLARLNTNDVDGAIADFDAAVNLEDNYDTLSARAFAGLAAGDEKGAADFMLRAIRRDKDNYNLWGIVILYVVGRDAEAGAMTDLLLKATPGDGYGQIWKAMLLERQDKSGLARTGLQKALSDRESDWPSMLMRWMLGKINDETLIRKAHEGTDRDIRGQLCEANFYLGERNFRVGKKQEAAGFFDASVKTGVMNFIEFHTAGTFLRRLEAEGISPAQ